MAIEIMQLAWDVRGITATQKLVLMDLADSANRDTRQCWPSVERIVARTGAGRRTVFEALDVLEDQGLISRDQRHNRSTMYTILMGAESAPRGAPAALVGAKTAPLEVRNPHTEPSEEPSLNRKKNQVVLADSDFPAGLDAEAWDLWLKYRKEICKPFKSQQTLLAQAQKLAAFGKNQRLVVQQSIDEGWQGLFAVKADAPAKGPIPAQLWDADSEQWVATHGLPKWKVDKLIKQAEDSKAFESTFAGTAPVKRYGGAST